MSMRGETSASEAPQTTVSPFEKKGPLSRASSAYEGGVIDKTEPNQAPTRFALI